MGCTVHMKAVVTVTNTHREHPPSTPNGDPDRPKIETMQDADIFKH